MEGCAEHYGSGFVVIVIVAAACEIDVGMTRLMQAYMA